MKYFIDSGTFLHRIPWKLCPHSTTHVPVMFHGCPNIQDARGNPYLEDTHIHLKRCHIYYLGVYNTGVERLYFIIFIIIFIIFQEDNSTKGIGSKSTGRVIWPDKKIYIF